MSRLMKIRRAKDWPNYIEVFRDITDRRYFTQLCYLSFERITGISLKEGETKIIKVSEVKNVCYRVPEKKQKVRRKNRITRRTGKVSERVRKLQRAFSRYVYS